jgi:hypothetical protein
VGTTSLVTDEIKKMAGTAVEERRFSAASRAQEIAGL